MKINHTMCILKVLTDSCVKKIKAKNKTKNENKKYFPKSFLQFSISQKILIEHKENCLIINGKETVKLKSVSIKFNNYFKQLVVPFKIYAGSECLLKGVKNSDKNNSLYTKNYQVHISCNFSFVKFRRLFLMIKDIYFIMASNSSACFLKDMKDL